MKRSTGTLGVDAGVAEGKRVTRAQRSADRGRKIRRAASERRLYRDTT